MLRTSIGEICKRKSLNPFPQQFRFITINHKEDLLEQLDIVAKEGKKLVYEVKPIAEVVHNSSQLMKNLLHEWKNSLNSTQTNNKHIIGSVPMPLNLINRVSANNIQSIDINEIQTFKFVIRKNYPAMYNKCTLERNGIIGTPGIAKSVSLLYPLLDHIANKPANIPVLLHSKGNGYLFLDETCWEINNLMTDPIAGIATCLRKYPGLLYLVDGPTGKKSHIEIEGKNSKTILASSPAKEHYQEFLKDGVTLMMPGWSLEELLEAREDINPKISEETVRERYRNVGGVVRGIFSAEVAAEKYFQAVKAAVAIEIRAPNNMIKMVDVEKGFVCPDIGAQTPFSHKIYHFVVDPNEFMTQKVIFASEWVRSNLEAPRLEKLKYQYLEERKEKSGSEAGALYERYVYDSWCGATTRMENIVTRNKFEQNGANTKIWRPQEEALHICTPESFCKYVEKLSKETLDKDGYVTIIKPQSETFPAVDFGVYDHSTKSLRLVQTTINENKRLSADNLMLFSGLAKIDGVKITFLLVTERKHLLKNAKNVWERGLGKKREEIEKWLAFDAILYGEEENFWQKIHQLIVKFKMLSFTNT